MKTTHALLLSVFVVATAAFCSAADGGFDAWARAAFLGEPIAKTPAPVGLEVRRQDHGEFQKNLSVMKTPLRLGEKSYAHGLGTHSVSEIVVRLEKPAKLFEAEAGIDNNYDTDGKRGSAVFAVEVGGKEAFRSGVRRGSDGPLPVRVELGGAREFTLRVSDAGDGPSHDQSDWAEAAVTFEDGSRKRLDELPAAVPTLALANTLPFSFSVGGKPSAELLPSWKVTREAFSTNGKNGHRLTYRDAATGLEVCCELTLFPEFSAVEWVLRFRNTGAADSPVLEAIKPLDLRIAMPTKREQTHRFSPGGRSVGGQDGLAARAERRPVVGRLPAVLQPRLGRRRPGRRDRLVGPVGDERKPGEDRVDASSRPADDAAETASR
ncbi:MAG: NPCBM/NEW2 domain-containing protein [Verrucomicrobia bacterium]|nr:NPCBM/NEW2 domain-containing protein [Verrucomicrobiota bacterium]